MTKRYILPTWEEFSKDRMVLVGYTNDPFTVKVGDRPVRKDDYNAIREATAVEDGRSPLATEALVEFAKNVLRKQNRETLATLKTDDTVTISIAAPQFVHLWYLAHGEESPLTPLIEESERLVGKARGEDGLGWKDVFGPKPGASWADVGGGEEKPVREVDGQLCPIDGEWCSCLKDQCKLEKLGHEPKFDKPRCGTCQFYGNDRNDYQRVCKRYPDEKPHEFNDWCGEWRAK